MNLDEQLRAALNHEAGMQTPTLPDIEGLISGGQARRRRRSIRSIGVAAAAAVLVGAGALGAMQFDLGDAGSGGPSNQSTPTSDPTTTPLQYSEQLRPEPGTYRKTVGSDASGAPIEADLTFEDPGWYFGGQPVISTGDESSSAGLGLFEATALPDRSGCWAEATGYTAFREAATTLDALGRQLAKLPSSEVVQPITPTVAFGYDALHLRLRIDAECPVGEVYMVAEGGGLGITYNAPWRIVIDFLVVDVDGTPIVVARWHEAHAPSELVDQATRVRSSITFVPREPTN
ncbi:MAG TPA: hypothetical protein VLI04_22095 [Nocardioidaceae bacterium]|nr:hypothetical protein [Nocardioidaceae bacterium]